MATLPWLAPAGHNRPPAQNASPECIALIAEFEGFSARPYLCPANYWTYGYGSLHDERGRRVTQTTLPISEEIARHLLERDVEIAERAVRRLIAGPLTQGQFDALVSFTYNLGAGALQRSTLRRRLNRGDKAGAASEFGKWIYAGGRPLKGLARRRAAEAALFTRRA